jgi:hypothetical protein
MKAGEFTRRLVATAIFLGIGFSVHARSLSEQLDTLFGERGVQLDVERVDPRIPPHTAHFSDPSLTSLGLLTKQLAASAADFPAISTVPGFTFRYNPQIQAFERSSTSLGSVFVERPYTLGRGKFDIGFAYLFIDFNELEGNDLDTLAFLGLPHNDCCGPRPSPGSPRFELATVDLLFEKFTLQSHVLSLFATYGITDRWDVNILLPIVFTELDVRARARVNEAPGLPISVHVFDVALGTTEEVRSVHDNATGVGDLQLRTKYHLLESKGFNLASGLNLRIPTGNEDDFQGIGDTTLTPSIALSQEYGRFDIHGSAGIEINTNDLDRSRARYAAGVTYQVLERIALLADVIGSSGLTDNTISVRVPQFFDPPPAGPSGFFTDTRTVRTDIVDLAVGFKINPYRSMVGFFNVFVPLNDEGLRAGVIPAAGLEMSF